MNKQELENEEVRQEEKKTKKKKVRKKKTMFGHIRSIISILLVVGIIGGSYWYYAFQYRAEVEPETNRKVTEYGFRLHDGAVSENAEAQPDCL